MIYVGINIAKETHIATAMNADGVVLIEPFTFRNNHEGFKLLKSKLDTLKGDILIGLESTANYAENVIFFSAFTALQTCCHQFDSDRRHTQDRYS